MATNKHILSKFGLTLWMATAVVMPNVGNAAPGTLASVPLFTQANADPNILFHLDSSGSMRHILAESPYDADVTYDANPDNAAENTCTGGNILAAGETVTLSISSGDPKITYNGANYDLGNGTGKICFDPTLNYLATLHTNSGSGADIIYTGNYLNWYFNPGTTTGAWSDAKPETRTRMAAAQSTLTTLVSSLSNVRAGFSTFDGESGADIDVTVDDISTNLGNITTAISGTSASGYTPLAESLRDIGRYFSNNAAGSCGGGSNLILHPGDADQFTDTCTDVLGSRISTGGPVQYQCQSNFAILTTDGLATRDREIDSSLQDYDGDCTAAAQTAGGYTCGSYDMKNTETYEDSSRDPSDYLDDVAKALFEIDLRPDLDDANGNEVTNNVRTFVVGFADETVRNNQLLIDTANQGGGEFIFAEDANNLQTAFEAATSTILNLIGSAAAVTFNSATLGTNSAVYLALFNSSSWSGDLVAYDLNDTTGAIEDSTWSASTALDAMSDSSAINNRTILSFNGNQGIALDWPTDYQSPSATTELDDGQLRDLLSNAPYAFGTADADEKTANAAFGAQVVDFLRGDTSNEGSTFRSRTSRLGDIVHAGPVFVGAPELNWPDGSGANGDYFPLDTEAYSLYKYNTSSDTNPGKADRPGVVYVGSNDGMLHGFATEDGALGSAGDEVLAYAPRALFSTDSNRGYHYLTDPGYNHQFYVDLIPTVSDIYDATDGWRTILVGGLRGGGRAIYALDVTDPEDFSEANASNIVMGEFTSADDADLGYTFSRPSIALMENGRWAIVVGNGYNADTGAGATGEASLFILFLDADLSDGSWDLGTDYLKISTETGDTTTPNGLSTPTLVDMNDDGMIDRAYAGDLLGNLWAFDLGGSTGWDIAYSQGNTPKPLFIAGSGQPITVAPTIVMNPDVATAATNEPNTLVLFGTGQYVASGDNANLGAQAFYGVWDHGTKELDSSDLVAQTITESSGTRTISSNTVDYSLSTVHGWYINLDVNSDGERIVTNPVVRSDIVYFNTSIPTDTTCSYGGTGWQMSIQYASGANPTDAVFDSDGDGDVDNSDTALSGVEFEQGLPAAPSFLSNRRYTPGTRTQTGGEVANDAVEELKGLATGRLSWEELSQ